MLEVGSVLDGKYRILSVCGRGGMSVVYKAVNERANKIWAIKEVRRDGERDFKLCKNCLLTETEILKRLKHPGLPSIIDVLEGGDGGNESFLIVMDFIEGETLKERLRREICAEEEVVEWAGQLCEVLEYLHSADPPIIYRDLKPSNIMLRPDGRVVLFDFGTAREYKESGTEDTVILGTRGYAAPEQYGGGQTDARTDIYCLGATMYHLLTGHNPGEAPYEMYPIRRWNPDLPGGLENIILRCTHANPADRYQSCAQLLSDLKCYRERDEGYKRRQKRKLCTFIILSSAATAFGAGSLAFYEAEAKEAERTYQYLLDAAESAFEKSEEIKYYHRAVSTDPGREEGYLRLLSDGYLDDNLLSADESADLRSLLNESADGIRTNEQIFKEKNGEGYAKFCYEAGIAYYYKLEGDNNKKNSKRYFKIAKESEYLTARQRARASRLYVIAGYYDGLSVPDRTGDETITYRDYWDDLREISAGDLVREDNANTALIMYREIAAQIISHADELKRDGVGREELTEELDEIEIHIGEDFCELTESELFSIEESMSELKESLSQARRVIEAAYGS